MKKQLVVFFRKKLGLRNFFTHRGGIFFSGRTPPRGGGVRKNGDTANIFCAPPLCCNYHKPPTSSGSRAPLAGSHMLQPEFPVVATGTIAATYCHRRPLAHMEAVQLRAMTTRPEM